MTLEYFSQMYEEILQSKLSRSRKDRKLAQLMTGMERTYKIPMIRNHEWEQQNIEVIELYRQISFSRNL